MTVSGIILGIVLTVVLILIAVVVVMCLDNNIVTVIISIIGTVFVILLWIGMGWYYNNTASGARALKTQESNFTKGLERTIRIYDIEGDLLETYDGKLDIDYDDDRILFDDENGKRHIIYYGQDTVLIDEK